MKDKEKLLFIHIIVVVSFSLTKQLLQTDLYIIFKEIIFRYHF